MRGSGARWLAGLIVAFALGAGSACESGQSTIGGQTTNATPAPSLQPSPGQSAAACSLLTKPEVDALMGTKLGAGTETRGPVGADGCQYFGPTGSAANLAIFVYRGAQIETAQRMLDLVGSNHTSAVSGVGDEARASVVTDTSKIAVRRGALAISISVTAAVPRPDTEKLKSVATTLLSRA